MTPSPDIRICVDCGWAQFMVPASWLSAGWLGSKRLNNVTSLSEPKNSSGIFAA